MTQSRRFYPLHPRDMARVCRKLAADLRREQAVGGLPPIRVTAPSGGVANTISRAESADSLDEQADRWEHESKTGQKNETDRARIGL